MEQKEFLDFMNQFVRIHNQFSAVKRTQSCTFEGETYYPAEMHVLTLLSRNPDLTISHIAASLYITRSAGSQIVKKLAARGLVAKERASDNERVVNLSISEKGSEAVKLFIGFENESLSGFFNNFVHADSREIKVVRKYLNMLEEMFDKKLE